MNTAMRTFVCDVTRQAGSLALRYFRSDALQSDAKGAWDLVTDADRAAEELIIAAVRERFPDHDVLGEETGRSGTTARMCWLIDPLDGTHNFSRGLPTWCVSVALAEDGDVRYGAVFDPVHDELFYAQRGAGALLDGRPLRTSGAVDPAQAVVYCKAAHGTQEDVTRRIAQRLWGRVMRLRMSGSIGIALAAVAAGRMDAAMEPCGGPWDCAAGGLLVREAGGYTSTLDGAPMSAAASTVLAAATPELHRALQAVVSD
jgi:myo-inositol-1(or 4)-monophosphatase